MPVSADEVTPKTGAADGAGETQAGTDGKMEFQRQKTPLKTGALQDAIFNSANFSSIATDEKGVIQIFNVGAERMLGYTAAEVMNKITPADISDPQEVIARAKALSAELSTPITPGFEALVFKASRGIEDIYELTYIRKDGSRFPALVIGCNARKVRAVENRILQCPGLEQALLTQNFGADIHGTCIIRTCRHANFIGHFPTPGNA